MLSEGWGVVWEAAVEHPGALGSLRARWGSLPSGSLPPGAVLAPTRCGLMATAPTLRALTAGGREAGDVLPHPAWGQTPVLQPPPGKRGLDPAAAPGTESPRGCDGGREFQFWVLGPAMLQPSRDPRDGACSGSEHFQLLLFSSSEQTLRLGMEKRPPLHSD